jgi:hypothetical protein
MKRAICIVDMSVLCEVLEVPTKSNEHKSYWKAWEERINAQERLLLPMATLFETGNHIGQNGTDKERRRTAAEFIRWVKQGIQGTAPFTTTPFVTPEALIEWLEEFEEWVGKSDRKGKGSGLGDLSIQREWKRQCAIHPRGRVYVWSKDWHLSACDRA